MTNLYEIAKQVTDEVLGEGTYDKINKGNLDPNVQKVINKKKNEKISQKKVNIKKDINNG